MSRENQPILSNKKHSKNKLKCTPLMQQLDESHQIHDLQQLEEDVHGQRDQGQKQALRQEVLEAHEWIDRSDGINVNEQMILDLIQDILGDLFDIIDLDEEDEGIRSLCKQYSAHHGLLRTRLFAIRDSLLNQKKSPWVAPHILNMETLTKLMRGQQAASLLQEIMSSSQLDQVLLFATMMKQQQLDEELTEIQKKEREEKIEKIIADLFEWELLEIYEIFIDQDGHIVIKLFDKENGEWVTLSFDPHQQSFEKLNDQQVAQLHPAGKEAITLLLQKMTEKNSKIRGFPDSTIPIINSILQWGKTSDQTPSLHNGSDTKILEK